jgi:hypothetical protein
MYYYKILDGQDFRLLSSSSPLSMGTEITEEEFNKIAPTKLNQMEEEIFVLKNKKIEEMENV